jgi:hypothetical protein
MQSHMAKQTFRPGERVPVSGQYRLVGTRDEVTSVQGERLPPTPKPGQRYVLEDRTRH